MKIDLSISRRRLIATSGAVAATSLTGLARAAQGEARERKPMRLPPPIGSAERVQRIARAQALMQRNDIGAVLIEAGPSLDYFAGIRWGRSERLTGVVIPVAGDPIVITPFFEKPTIAEMLDIPAEIRTWNEHDEPLKLVADFVRTRPGARRAVGIEETNRFFLVDRLQRQLPRARIVSANPVVRALRMRKTANELALMQAASDVTVAAIRETAPKLRAGMTAGQVSDLLSSAMIARGGSSPWALVLFGAAAALPHGTGKPQSLNRGDVVLIDTGCELLGYQSDISRTLVFDARPTPEQRKVWEQMARGQQIAFAAARLGVPAGRVDDAVRAAYTSWGYGPGYQLPGLSHRTGHGIGMEGHEPVNLVHGETTPLAIGMCFSNEPGIYLPGKFGIRLEDCFHITAVGPRYFSQPPKSIDEPV